MSTLARSEHTEAVPSLHTGRTRRWLTLVAADVLIPVLIFGLAELTLRVCKVGTPTGVTRPCTDRGRPAFCDNPAFTTPFFPQGMSRAPRPFAIPASKAPGTYRIFVVGESAAYGDPDPSYGFARYLEVMLRERFPQTNFEVINTGTTAINSHVLLPIVEDVAHYQPDLFVIYAGNNEVVGPYGPGTVLTSWGMGLPAIRAGIALNSTRIGQLVAKLSRSRKKNGPGWHGMEMFLDRQIRADSPRMKPMYEHFGTNLRDLIAVARRSGAQVVISTVATNLKDCAPFASLHREGMRLDELRSWNDLFQRGTVLESAGSYNEALKPYLAAAEIDSQYAELQFRIARCLWAVADFAGARERFVRARDLDTLRFRADSKINEIIRTLPGSDPGIGLVDAAVSLGAESDHEVPGSDLFYEYAHPNPHGNYLLGRALFQQVAGRLPPELGGSAVGVNALSEEECNRLLALTPYDRARVAGLILNKRERPPFTTQLNQTEEVQRLKTEATVSVDYGDIVAQYQWAILQNPQDRLLHLNYGFLLHRYEPAAADKELRAALPYDNAPVLCNWRKFD